MHLLTWWLAWDNKSRPLGCLETMHVRHIQETSLSLTHNILRSDTTNRLGLLGLALEVCYSVTELTADFAGDEFISILVAYGSFWNYF